MSDVAWLKCLLPTRDAAAPRLWPCWAKCWVSAGPHSGGKSLSTTQHLNYSQSFQHPQTVGMPHIWAVSGVCQMKSPYLCSSCWHAVTAMGGKRWASIPGTISTSTRTKKHPERGNRELQKCLCPLLGRERHGNLPPVFKSAGDLSVSLRFIWSPSAAGRSICLCRSTVARLKGCGSALLRSSSLLHAGTDTSQNHLWEVSSESTRHWQKWSC